MDIRMDEVDGVEARERIKGGAPTSKIIIVTGHDDEPLPQTAMPAGASGFAPKENPPGPARWLEEEGPG